MRYQKPINVVDMPAGQGTQYFWHMVVYVKNCRDAKRQFIATCKDNDCVFARETLDNKGRSIPQPCQDDTILAYEVFIPDYAGDTMESLCVVGASKSKGLGKRFREHLEQFQLQEINRERPILDYHFVSDEKIPYGMGKLSGMQKANRPKLDDARGKDTSVQHGTPIVKRSPLTDEARTENGRFATTTGTKVFNATVQEINENGTTAKRVYLPLVSKPKTGKREMNTQLREWTAEQRKELFARCKEYDKEHRYGYQHYFTQPEESYKFSDGGGI